MIRSRTVLFLALVSLTIGLTPTGVQAYSSGPPDGHSGAPGEPTCALCHSGGAGGGKTCTGGVAQEAWGFPETRDLRIWVRDPAAQRWGFQVSVFNENGAAFTVTDPTNTQLSDYTEPASDYLKHTSAGTFMGTPDSANWLFQWTSESIMFDASFYLAGVAANGDGTPNGDSVYTFSRTASSRPPLLPSTSPFGLIILLLGLSGLMWRKLRD